MPALDRRITVRVVTFSRDPQTRESIETNTDYAVWATRRDKELLRIIEEGGSTGRVARIYRVRFDQRFADAAPVGLRVIDADGVQTVTNLAEAAETGPLRERRRYLELETLGVAPQ